MTPPPSATANYDAGYLLAGYTGAPALPFRLCHNGECLGL